MTSSQSSPDRVQTLSGLVGRHTNLGPTQVTHLHRLLGEWQTLADLSFADCLMFAPTVDDKLVVLAQVRPYPAQTLYPDDLFGLVVPSRSRSRVDEAIKSGRILRDGDPEWRSGTPIREEVIPVRCEGTVIAAISVEQDLASARTPSQLELAYLRAAGHVAQMVSEGIFPFGTEEQIEGELSPRVGDGFLEVDEHGTIAYASPNAVSAYRRLGVPEVKGRSLREIGVGHKRVHNAMRAHRPTEDEVHAAGVWILRRFIPVIIAGELRGAIGLIRDVSESRKRDRLITMRDARLREIHHRVKNNLQTVASLLRIQARRLDSPEARQQLEESVRRISAIALVHDTLAQDPDQHVGFDEVAIRVGDMVTQNLARPDAPVRFLVEGRAGDLPADIATPMSLVLNELLQNAIDHAFRDRRGTIRVKFQRESEALLMTFTDDGPGLPEDFDFDHSGSLGLQIVKTMVVEMGGDVEVSNANPGTKWVIRVPVTED